MGDNNNNNYTGSSGTGSDVDYKKDTYVPFLKKFITDNKIKNVVDLGCGDFRCGHLIYDDLDVSYTGYDAYKNVVEYNSKQHALPKYFFFHLDFCNSKENIITGELCILHLFRFQPPMFFLVKIVLYVKVCFQVLFQFVLNVLKFVFDYYNEHIISINH